MVVNNGILLNIGNMILTNWSMEVTANTALFSFSIRGLFKFKILAIILRTCTSSLCRTILKKNLI